MKTTYSQIIDDVKDGLKESELIGSEVIAKAAVGLEDSSVDHEIVEVGLSKVETIVTEALKDLPGLEDSQIEAAIYGAQMDLSPASAVAVKRHTPADKGMTVIAGNAFGESDIYDTHIVATEGFDGQIVSNNVPFSFGANLVMAKQDEFTETIYPTVVLKPGESGCIVTNAVDKIEQQYLRSSGTPGRDKRKAVSIIKALTDENSILGGDKTRLLPVVNANNADYIVSAYAFATDVTGEVRQTAPIKPNITVDFAGISQTAAQLAQGVKSNVDALDDTVVLENFWYVLDDGTNSSTHKFDTSHLPAAKWTPTFTGDSKDIQLSLVTEAFSINTTKTKDIAGAASAVLTGLSIPDHTIYVRAAIHGVGNTREGDLSVTDGRFELVKIVDAAGALVDPSSATFTNVKAIIDSMVMTAWISEVYETNSTLRNLGYIITVDKSGTLFSVPYRTPISVLKPQINLSDTDNDANNVRAFGSQARAMSTILGIKKLDNYLGFLKNAVTNGVDLTDSDLAGPAKDLITPYYDFKTLDLETHVDGTNSKDIKDNVRGAIEAVISNGANEMFDGSGYLDAFENYGGNLGAKPTLIIATDRKLKNILTSAIDGLKINDSVNVKVVGTGNALFKNRIAIFPTTDSKKPELLNFGFRGYVPTPTLELRKELNGASVTVLFNQPAFMHFNTLPVAVEFEVTGFAETTKKIVANKHNV